MNSDFAAGRFSTRFDTFYVILIRSDEVRNRNRRYRGDCDRIKYSIRSVIRWNAPLRRVPPPGFGSRPGQTRVPRTERLFSGRGRVPGRRGRHASAIWTSIAAALEPSCREMPIPEAAASRRLCRSRPRSCSSSRRPVVRGSAARQCLRTRRPPFCSAAFRYANRYVPGGRSPSRNNSVRGLLAGQVPGKGSRPSIIEAPDLLNRFSFVSIKFVDLISGIDFGRIAPSRSRSNRRISRRCEN